MNLRSLTSVNEIKAAWCIAVSLLALSTNICFHVWSASTCRCPDSIAMMLARCAGFGACQAFCPSCFDFHKSCERECKQLAQHTKLSRSGAYPGGTAGLLPPHISLH